MMRLQHGISVLVSQTSFHRESSGGVAKCGLFSQTTTSADCRRATWLVNKVNVVV